MITNESIKYVSFVFQKAFLRNWHIWHRRAICIVVTSRYAHVFKYRPVIYQKLCVIIVWRKLNLKKKKEFYSHLKYCHFQTHRKNNYFRNKITRRVVLRVHIEFFQWCVVVLQLQLIPTDWIVCKVAVLNPFQFGTWKSCLLTCHIDAYGVSDFDSCFASSHFGYLSFIWR